jgi:hypothetical protein
MHNAVQHTARCVVGQVPHTDHNRKAFRGGLGGRESEEGFTGRK